MAAVAMGSSAAWADEEMPPAGIPGTRFERTFIAIKPDGVQRGLVGEIVQRFERKGYKLVAMKMVRPTRAFAEKHYADLNGRPFFAGLVEYFTSGPVVAMVFEGRHAIKNGRALVGATNPADAAPGSVRGDLCVDVGRNIIHGSDSPEAAAHEISLWFSAAEIARHELSTVAWIYEGAANAAPNAAATQAKAGFFRKLGSIFGIF